MTNFDIVQMDMLLRKTRWQRIVFYCRWKIWYKYNKRAYKKYLKIKYPWEKSGWKLVTSKGDIENNGN